MAIRIGYLYYERSEEIAEAGAVGEESLAFLPDYARGGNGLCPGGV